ncbi:extracellular solute-binding protein [Nocardioides zeae]|uniref:Extracellular solute-binding protein n=1 Tax=Nocardioides imazamoxiresistens TaxID=3231893 RepID=A0ABU3PU94_9ACTN|nr:extracellular solute-binding protein [Nocardioides zeae]MDT9592803.1 extracellular solute-binding protein [Nocardioides zeae]
MLTLALAACGGGSGGAASEAVEGSWDDVVAAANDEGEVLLYSSQNPTRLDALEAAFEAAYPDIDMKYVRGTDAEMNPKVEVENQTGRGAADVHMVTDAAWITTASESGTYSVDDLRGPSFEAEAFNRDENVLADSFFLTSAAVFAMGWNTNEVPDGFEEPQDMLSDEYAGKLGIVNPQGIAAYVDFFQFYEENFGPDFLEQLAELEPRIYPSALGIAQALTSGEIAAAPGVQPLVAEVESGAPVDWKLPEPAWGTPWYSHVLSSAPHPNAAQVLADFMVSPEGQAALNTGYASVLGDGDGAVADASDIELPDPDALTPEQVQAYQQEWESLFLR